MHNHHFTAQLASPPHNRHSRGGENPEIRRTAAASGKPLPLWERRGLRFVTKTVTISNRRANGPTDFAGKVDPFTRAHQNAVLLQLDPAGSRQVTVESGMLFKLPAGAAR
jgi:hypothetical protein